MIHAHIDKESAIPLWAAFGAPLLVVPLLVALLAIWSPRHTVNGVVGSEVGIQSEQVQTSESSATALPAESRELVVRARS